VKGNNSSPPQKKIGFLKPSCFLSSVQVLWKIDCTDIIPSIKDRYVWCVFGSAAKRIRDDVTIHWCLTPARLSATPRCIAACQVSNTHSFLLFRQSASFFPRPSVDTQLLSILFSNLPRWVSSISYAKISVAVVGSESGLLTFTRSYHFLKWIWKKLELTDVFRTKRRWNVPKSCKLAQAFWRCEQSNVLASRSGLVFLTHRVCIERHSHH